MLLPETLAAVWLAAMGLVIGSFLNVVIARLPSGESLVHPRSRCPRCAHAIAWYENVPVLSWLWLRGRCSGCKAPISARYPLVELLTAALFMGCLARFGWTWELVPALMLVAFLVPLTFIDLERWLLPFSLTIPGIVMGLLLSAPLGLERLRDAALGAALGFVSFWGMEWLGEKIFRKEALGGGDKWLLALLGAFLTYRPLLGVVFLSSFQGSIVGLLLLAIRGRAGPAPVEQPEQAVPASEGEEENEDEDEDDWVPGPTNLPFGPWLSLAALELLLLGPWLESLLPDIVGRLLVGS